MKTGSSLPRRIAWLVVMALALLPARGQQPARNNPTPGAEFTRVGYDDINTERLRLAVAVRLVSPRSAVLQGVNFEQLTVNGLPVFVEPYDGDVKLEKDRPVALPKPLFLELYYREVSSFDGVRQLLRTRQLQLRGTAHVKVRLTGAAGFFTLGESFRASFPIDASLNVDLLEHPLLRSLADRVLAELSDPQSAVNVRWVEEKLQLQAVQRAGEKLAPGVVLIETRYVLVDNRAPAPQEFVHVGVGFLLGPQRLLTAKQVVEPWKFDADAAAQLAAGVRLDAKGYNVAVWPAKQGEGEPPRPALRLSTKEISIERVGDDDWATPSTDSAQAGTAARLHRVGSARNLAVLRLRGKLGAAQPLVAEAAAEPQGALLGLQYTPPVTPVEDSARRNAWAMARWEPGVVRLDRRFPVYAAGAPLYDVRGRVRAIYLGGTFSLPIEAALPLLKK